MNFLYFFFQTSGVFSTVFRENGGCLGEYNSRIQARRLVTAIFWGL